MKKEHPLEPFHSCVSRTAMCVARQLAAVEETHICLSTYQKTSQELGAETKIQGRHRNCLSIKTPQTKTEEKHSYMYGQSRYLELKLLLATFIKKMYLHLL